MRALYQGFFGGMFSIGSILSFMLLPHLVKWGWRWIFLLAAIASLITLLMIPFLRLKPEGRGGAVKMPLSRMVVLRSAWVIGIFHAFSYGSVLNLGNWIPSVLSEISDGTTAATFAWLGALVMLISGVSRFAGGFILFRFRDLRVGIGTVIILGILYVLIALLHIPAILVILALLLSFFGSINFGAFWQLAGKLTTPASLGTMFGFVNLLANLGTVGFTIMFGWFKDSTGTFFWGFGAMALMIAVGLLLGGRVLIREITAAESRE